MAQQWGFQGPPTQGQGLQTYYPDHQYQQPPEYQYSQQQMHSTMHTQQYARPQEGPQLNPSQQQMPQYQGTDFAHQQYGPHYSQPPAQQFPQPFKSQFHPQSGPHSYQQSPPQHSQQPGPYSDQQTRPRFGSQSGYQQDQQYQQLNGYTDPTFHQQPQIQVVVKNFGPPPKPLVKLARPTPLTCFNCGSPDHWAMYCQEPRRVVPA